MATTLPLANDDPALGTPAGEQETQAKALRAAVLAALGRPADLLRVVVTHLWGDRYRVNVITGDGPDSARIPHSYFVAADGRGNILGSSPIIRTEY